VTVAEGRERMGVETLVARRLAVVLAATWVAAAAAALLPGEKTAMTWAGISSANTNATPKCDVLLRGGQSSPIHPSST